MILFPDRNGLEIGGYFGYLAQELNAVMDNKRILELIELLSEYLQKTDRILDKMDRHDVSFDKYFELFDKQFKRMDMAYQVIVGHSEKIEVLHGETKHLQDESNKQMTEILSISRRVRNIEDKN